MAVDPTTMSNAISAYGNVARGGSVSSSPVADDSHDEFASLVKSAIREAVKESKETERLSMAASFGQADLGQVVTAVAEAEVTLQTVTTLRDKMVEAYKEILRTPM